jgi:hypothetical protein
MIMLMSVPIFDKSVSSLVTTFKMSQLRELQIVVYLTSSSVNWAYFGMSGPV